MMDSIELQHWLMEVQQQQQGKGEGEGNNKLRVRTYATSPQCQKDMESLSRIGLEPSEIARALEVPLLRVRKYQAMVERAKAEEREFLATGFLPWEESEGGYVAILQK
jgi:hypothetical protein